MRSKILSQLGEFQKGRDKAIPTNVFLVIQKSKPKTMRQITINVEAILENHQDCLIHPSVSRQALEQRLSEIFDEALNGHPESAGKFPGFCEKVIVQNTFCERIARFLNRFRLRLGYGG